MVLHQPKYRSSHRGNSVKPFLQSSQGQREQQDLAFIPRLLQVMLVQTSLKEQFHLLSNQR